MCLITSFVVFDFVLTYDNREVFLRDLVEHKNSVALVRERTIPTERPPPVGEVSANFLRIQGCHVVSETDPHGR